MSYFKPEDLKKFGEITDLQPEMGRKFFAWYNEVFKDRANDGSHSRGCGDQRWRYIGQCCSDDEYYKIQTYVSVWCLFF